MEMGVIFPQTETDPDRHPVRAPPGRRGKWEVESQEVV